MSMELMVKAMKTKVGNPLRKLVLIKLADNANDQGECWPSYQHVADQCEISKRSVMNHIEALCRAGMVRKELRKGGPKGNSSNVYHLSLDGASPAPVVVQEIHQGSAAPALPSAAPALPPSAAPAPRTSHSLEPVNEPVSEPFTEGPAAPSPSATEDRDDGFDLAWKVYPKRSGANPKTKAHSAWKARLKEGVTAETMLAGVARYAAYSAAKGSLGTEFIMQAVRFFGTERAYENDWTNAPAPASGETAKPASLSSPASRDYRANLTPQEDGSYAF